MPERQLSQVEFTTGNPMNCLQYSNQFNSETLSLSKQTVGKVVAF